MSGRTPSDLPEKHIEYSEEEVELQEWVKGLKKHFPTVPVYFIETLAKAYQLNPEKFNDIIENDRKIPAPKQDKPGSYDAVNVYSEESEIPDMKDVEDVFAAEYSASVN